MDGSDHSLEVITSPQQEYDALRYVSAEFPCSYLPGRMARHEAYRVDQLAPAAYEPLLARGFRRSGSIVYRPRCRGCRECRQLRVLVDRFAPTHSMRRIARRNNDIRVEVGPCRFDESKHALFAEYLDAQHDGSMSREADAFRDFLYESPTATLEFLYFLGQRLVGVSIADQLPSGLSSVYMFFDPSHAARSLGTFSILWEIDYCRQKKMPHYYLGYLVSGCHKMAYKARFTPYELLVADQRWIGFAARGNA